MRLITWDNFKKKCQSTNKETPPSQSSHTQLQFWQIIATGLITTTNKQQQQQQQQNKKQQQKKTRKKSHIE